MADMKKPLLSSGSSGAGGHAQQMAEFSDKGLSSAEAKEKLQLYGYNEIVEKKKPFWKILLTPFWGPEIYKPSPIALMMWTAIIVSAAIQDWVDFGIILGLHAINGVISLHESHKAGNAVAALKAALAPKARAKRDGQWGIIEARELVPGDLVLLKLGDVVPADSKLIGEPDESCDLDQSGLTGESLPVQKFPGQVVYSGTAVKRGEMEAVVVATGGETEFGKTASMIQSVEKVGNFQKVLFNVAKVLIILAFVLVVVMIIVLLVRKNDVASTIQTALVLLVASIPIAMPVVCTTTMAVGARRLAAANAVVTSLSSIEELAGMTILCSDKTGTLTKNELTLDDPWCTGCTGDDLVFYSALASKDVDPDAIDLAIRRNCKNIDLLKNYIVDKFVPFNPVDKRTEASVRGPDGRSFKVSKGAVPVILKLAWNQDKIKTDVDAAVSAFASKGLRSLGCARTNDAGQWEFLGIISLFDPPRHDTKQVIEDALKLGSEVKMITGDHLLIAKETARRLGMGSNILGHEQLEKSESELMTCVAEADGFAEVFPEHKFKIVECFQKMGHTTGMTGDGVNDAPALKKANIGFAVHGATPAAQGAASVVLMTPGLGVIITAIIRSRKIFQRMKNYCIYRVNISLMLLLTTFVCALAFDKRLPAIVVVLMALLNDATIMTISYDKVRPSPKPERWNLPEVILVAATLGLVSTAACCIMVEVVKTYFNDVIPFSANGTTPSRIECALFLLLSLLGELSVFSARTDHAFFTRRPGFALLTALACEMLISTLLARFWPFGQNIEAISWEVVGYLWLVAVGVFVIQENLKTITYYVVYNFQAGEDKEAATQARKQVRRELAMKEAAGSTH